MNRVLPPEDWEESLEWHYSPELERLEALTLQVVAEAIEQGASPESVPDVPPSDKGNTPDSYLDLLNHTDSDE